MLTDQFPFFNGKVCPTDEEVDNISPKENRCENETGK